MTRRSLSNNLSNHEFLLSDVWNWYEFQRAILTEEKNRVTDGFPDGHVLLFRRYLGKTLDELQMDFSLYFHELSHLAMLGMLVAVEAALRIDFVVRVENKLKDAVSRRYWTAFQKQGIDKIRLVEDILDVWSISHSTRIKRAVAEFKGALKLRHWLAHGRYWKPKLGRAGGYDPPDIFDICNELLISINPAPTPRT